MITIADECGIRVFGNEDDGPDAYEARKAETAAMAETLRAKARRFRRLAETMLQKAESFETAASGILRNETAQETDPWEYDPWGYDPDPLVLARVGGLWRAFDPVELMLHGVENFDPGTMEQHADLAMRTPRP